MQIGDKIQMKKIFKIATKFIGIIIFVIILYKTDWQKFRMVFAAVDPVRLSLIYTLMIPTMLLMSYRWHYALSKLSINRTFFANITLLFSGMLMGFITPGRVGEFYPLFRLHKEGHSKAKGAFIIILVRLFDFVFLLISGIFAVYFIISLKNSDARMLKIILWLVLFAVILVFLGIFVYRDYFADKAGFFMKKIFKLEIEKENILASMKKLNGKTFVYLIIITASFWILYFFQLYLFGSVLGVEISFYKMFFVLTLVSLAAALPITMVGLGTREFAMINLLAIFSVAKEKALAVSLMSYSFMIISMFIATILWSAEHRKD